MANRIRFLSFRFHKVVRPPKIQIKINLHSYRVHVFVVGMLRKLTQPYLEIKFCVPLTLNCSVLRDIKCVKPRLVDDDKYLWYFIYIEFRIDASVEDGSLGRLVNDDHKNPNTTMKTIVVDGSPRLCLFARRKILTFEEIRYDYGVGHYPWRVKVIITF